MGPSGDAYTYDMYFQAPADAGADAWTGVAGWADHRGAGRQRPQHAPASVLDFNRDCTAAGWASVTRTARRDPSASPTMAGPPPDLSGDVAQRVIQVLDAQINPSIAAHGGHADLVAVEDGAAYLRLSGGCAGCGMAAVTLSQGIEVAIKQSVPEILQVVDVTDHAAGTNPYYEAAKK